MYDRLSVSDFGDKWPLNEKFWKCLSGFRDGTPNYVSRLNLVKIDCCEVAERSSRLPHRKKIGLCGIRFSSRFAPKWVDRAQNSLNVVTPWHVHVYLIWSGSAAFCWTSYRKIDFLAQKVGRCGIVFFIFLFGFHSVFFHSVFEKKTQIQLGMSLVRFGSKNAVQFGYYSFYRAWAYWRAILI